LEAKRKIQGEENAKYRDPNHVDDENVPNATNVAMFLSIFPSNKLFSTSNETVAVENEMRRQQGKGNQDGRVEYLPKDGMV
jgi:hypothetical protein